VCARLGLLGTPQGSRRLLFGVLGILARALGLLLDSLACGLCLADSLQRLIAPTFSLIRASDRRFALRRSQLRARLRLLGPLRGFVRRRLGRLRARQRVLRSTLKLLSTADQHHARAPRLVASLLLGPVAAAWLPARIAYPCGLVLGVA
jgi:hypothetical protein